MDRRGIVFLAWIALGCCGSAPWPLFASGFSVPDQSARAMAMGSAATTQAAEPSALFYNVGAAAFAEERTFALTALQPIAEDETFFGRPPNSGTASVFAQESPDLDALRASGFWIEPLSDAARVGLAVYTPFSLDTDWSDPTTFAGREVATQAEIFTLDVNPSIAVRLGRLGLGIGAVYRVADVSLSRRLATFNPSNGDIVDFAAFDIEGGQDDGIGWNAGIFHQVNGRFAWGLAYRSGIEIDFGGAGLLTQVATGNDQLDALLAATTPFDQDLPLSSRIDFPALGSLGLGFGVTRNTRLAIDLQWTEWSKVDALPFTFATFPLVNDTVRLDFEDVLGLRLGVEITTASGSQWRFGASMDEAAQPLGTIGPVIADADRLSISAGFGKDWLDVALTFIQFDDGIASGRTPDGINGTYQNEALLLAVTVKKP